MKLIKKILEARKAKQFAKHIPYNMGSKKW